MAVSATTQPITAGSGRLARCCTGRQRTTVAATMPVTSGTSAHGWSAKPASTPTSAPRRPGATPTFASVEALGDGHAAADLERRDEDRQRRRRARRARAAIAMNATPAIDRDGGQPERERDPAIGPGGAQPGLHDDGERELAREGRDEHGDRDEALLRRREEARGDRHGRGGDHRERDPAEQGHGADGRAAQAQRRWHVGRSSRHRLRPRPPSTRPSEPSTRPRKTHQPSSGWYSPAGAAGRRRAPRTTNATRHHAG